MNGSHPQAPQAPAPQGGLGAATSKPQKLTSPSVRPSLSREEKEQNLRQALLPTVEFLRRRRADLIDMRLIDDYVDRNWMEWHGGSLRLTVTGRNVCAQMVVKPR